MRKYIIVHGIVQGVGYRHFVKQVADRLKVKGFAKNEDDGSVHVLADAGAGEIERFEKEIDIDTQNGAQVFSIEEDRDLLDRYADVIYQLFAVL